MALWMLAYLAQPQRGLWAGLGIREHTGKNSERHVGFIAAAFSLLPQAAQATGCRWQWHI